METCTVETGLLKKKPCEHPAVTHCANCEQALCAQHAIAELTDTGHKSGKFLCKECEAAHRQQRKSLAAAPKPATPAAAAPTAAKGTAPAAAKPPAAPAAAAPAETKGKEGEDSLGGIDFTPSKPK